MKYSVTPDQRKLVMAISEYVKEYTHQYNPLTLHGPEDFKAVITEVVEGALKKLNENKAQAKL